MLRTILPLAWIALLGAAAAGGGLPLPGAEALRGWRAWWETRRFDEANHRQDYLASLAHGRRLLELTGNDEAFRMAAYALGLDWTAPSRGLPRRAVLATARAARAPLVASLSTLPDPYDALRVDAILVAARLLPLEPADAEELAVTGRRRIALLLACGRLGGPQRAEAAYRAWLALSEAEREAWLDARLALLGRLAGGLR